MIVPRGGKDRSPLKYIIIKNEIFRFRGEFCRVLTHRLRTKGNFFSGSIHFTCCSPSFAQHPVLHYGVYTPKAPWKVLAMEWAPTFVGKM